MSTVTVKINLDGVEGVLADRAAAELADKIENLELTVDGTTSILHHTVVDVKVTKK